MKAGLIQKIIEISIAGVKLFEILRNSPIKKNLGRMIEWE